MSRTDADAKIARMKDGTTHLAYKPEHAVDPDTGAVVATEIHPADDWRYDDVVRHAEGGRGEPGQSRSGAVDAQDD